MGRNPLRRHHQWLEVYLEHLLEHEAWSSFSMETVQLHLLLHHHWNFCFWLIGEPSGIFSNLRFLVKLWRDCIHSDTFSTPSVHHFLRILWKIKICCGFFWKFIVCISISFTLTMKMLFGSTRRRVEKIGWTCQQVPFLSPLLFLIVDRLFWKQNK